jgi:hypothetical protein
LHVFGVGQRQPLTVLRLGHVAVYQLANPLNRLPQAVKIVYPLFVVLKCFYLACCQFNIVFLVQLFNATASPVRTVPNLSYIACDGDSNRLASHRARVLSKYFRFQKFLAPFGFYS